MCPFEPVMESKSGKDVTLSMDLSDKSTDQLKEGFILALHTRGNQDFMWLDKGFLVVAGSLIQLLVSQNGMLLHNLLLLLKARTVGLQSFAAGGKLLQINRKMEFIFASRSFDEWESWMLEGSVLDQCKLINCRNPSVLAFKFIEKNHSSSECRRSAYHCELIYFFP